MSLPKTVLPAILATTGVLRNCYTRELEGADDGGVCKERVVPVVVWPFIILFPIAFGAVHCWVTLTFMAIFAVLMWVITDYHTNGTCQIKENYGTRRLAVDARPAPAQKFRHLPYLIGNAAYLHTTRSDVVERSLAGFAEELRRGKPDDFSAWGRQAAKFEHGDSGFFEGGDVMLGAQGGGDQIIEVRSVAEDKDGGIVFVFGEFPK